MSNIQNGGAGRCGKQLAEHTFWFWSSRANIPDHSKKTRKATVQAELLLVRGTGTKPEHPGPVLPHIVLWGQSGHLERDTLLVVTQKTCSPPPGGLSGPLTNRASKVAGVAVSKHPCDLRYVQILLHQKLNRPLSPGPFEHLRETRPLLRQ